jgi:hypothetical protein
MVSLRRWRLIFIVVLSSLYGVHHLTQVSAQAPAVNATERPRLALLLVFDQLRGDYLTRWQHLFGDDGFRRLQRDGVWFANCHYPYAHTVTGAGHASLVTGCSPAEHGIVGNDWYDRAAGKSVNCVTGLRAYTQVPSSAPSVADELLAGTGFKARGVSPERLLVPTIGDVLKEATGGKSRVVSLSLKDRSAVLPAGKRPDACYWFSSSSGTFVTSSYYRERVHPWIEAWNRDHTADRYFAKQWSRFRPDVDYEKNSGPDDVVGESTGFAQGRTFPHATTGGLRQPGRLYYEALINSPFGNDLLFDLVQRAIESERLGQEDSPDLLCVSFSSNDLIGHCWGPDSQEVLDVTLRTDRLVQDFLRFLDAKVGQGRYLLVLTADHGICPLVEVSQSRGQDAGRVEPALLSKNAEECLSTTFGRVNGGRWLEAASYPWVYLNPRTMKANGANEAAVEQALARWFETQPGINRAYSRTRLGTALPEEDAIGRAVRRSFYPDRCGDVYVVQKPNYLFSTVLGNGTTHGTPYDYDTHVPLIVYGTGIRGSGHPSREAITPQASAAILAQGLKIDIPSRAAAPVPESLKRP